MGKRESLLARRMTDGLKNRTRPGFLMEPPVRIELTTFSLRVRVSFHLSRVRSKIAVVEHSLDAFRASLAVPRGRHGDAVTVDATRKFRNANRGFLQSRSDPLA